jgi:putative tricarboxylic transport membrane protein
MNISIHNLAFLILLFIPAITSCDNTNNSTPNTISSPTVTAAEYPTETISIMVPAAPGGGWDKTARAMQSALSTVTKQKTEVYNVPGAGGTIGLAKFINDNAGKPHQLMVMGSVMVGAIETNKSPVKLNQVTPIATLTSESLAIAVSSQSKYQNLQQLIKDFKSEPTAISWGGGAVGGTDHILVGLIAKETGVNSQQINYIAHAGGGEALAAILSNAVTVGVSSVSEFKPQIEAGAMRLLAISSNTKLPGINTPTLKEQGLNITLSNWRAVVAPPQLSSQQTAAIVAVMKQMYNSPKWQEALKQNNWQDSFKADGDLQNFLNEESNKTQTVLKDIGLVNK